jgi:O-antigen ligase
MLPAALRALGLTDRRGITVARAATAVAVTAATLAVAALNEHDPYDIHAGLFAQVVAGLVPLLLGMLAGLAVLRPRAGFIAALVLTPVIDVAQVSWIMGPLQVISQTIVLVALGVGLLLRDRSPEAATSGATSPVDPSGRAGRRYRVSLTSAAAGAVVALLALAALSTVLSPKVDMSAAVLLHGILEPMGMAAVLLALRPTRRDLILVAVLLGVSVAIGGLLNMIQTLAVVHSLSVLQAQRLLFSRITYFNVGLFGEMLAMATPLLIASIAGRRLLNLRRWVVLLLVIVTLTALASLFLTFSKSAYLATAGGSMVLILLVVRGWRRRAEIVLVAGLLSATVIPWPAFFLQVSPPLANAYRSAVVSLVGESRYDSWNPSTLSGRGSLLERFYATRAAVEMAIDHPVLGIGLDQFLAQYVGHYKPPEAKLDLDSAHSMWPEIAAELGIPALLLAWFIYGCALLAAWRVYRSPPDDLTRLLAAALLAAMTAWLVVGTAFAGDMYRPWRNMSSDYVMAFVLVAAAFALYRMTRRLGPGAAVERARPRRPEVTRGEPDV